MKAADYRNMSDTDLKEQIREQREALSKLKFSHHIAGTENPMHLRFKRREIARMITVLNEKQKTGK
jgi:large subunit ribosomal protein L29